MSYYVAQLLDLATMINIASLDLVLWGLGKFGGLLESLRSVTKKRLPDPR